MINLKDGKITDLIQNSAKYNPEIKALSYAVLQEKKRIIDQAQRTRTLALIDELPENILDLLAVELRTPLYQGDFDIESKRALIKETLIFFTYMGTPEAVNRMLSAVYPGSYIEEWYTYGGEPYHFQVILEMSNFRQPAKATTIAAAVKKVKRLTAHMDGLVYQCNIGIVIRTHGQGYKYRSAWSGRTWAGTEPWRSTRGGLEHLELEAGTHGAGYEYHSDLTGTKPWRDMRGGLEHEDLKVGIEAKGWDYTSEFSGRVEAGTEPWRSTKGGSSPEAVKVKTEAAGFEYSTPAAGTVPKRSTITKTEESGIDILSDRQAYSYTSSFAGQVESGTTPQRSQLSGMADGELQVEAAAQGFTYAVAMAGETECGTEPERNKMGIELDSGFYATADGEGYRYRVIACGTSYCNNKRRRSLC